MSRDFTMTRILVVVPDFFPSESGYSHASINAVAAYASLGFEIHVISYREALLPNWLADYGVRLHSFVTDSLEELEKLFVKSLHGDWDAVIFETYESSNKGLVLLDVVDVPVSRVAVRIHAATETETFLSGPNEYYRYMFECAKRLDERIGHVWSTTWHYVEFHKKHYRTNPQYQSATHYALLPNFPSPVKPDLLHITPEISAWLSSGPRSLLLLGRMSWQGVHQKNFPNVLQALHALVQEDPDFLSNNKIIFIGDGDERRNLFDMAVRLGIEPYILFVNYLPHLEVVSLIYRVSGAILASRYEGHSMFAVECLESGCPLLVAENTGIEEYVFDDVTGVKIKRFDDVFDIAEGIKRLTSRSWNRRDVAAAYCEMFGLERVRNKANLLFKYLLADRL
ncbi:glycosyltransferase family 4 protein [Mangrovitalea sediminis]|uniref:glycosyltransferase family 4 protein n=1 Tax=Mangrovitalea sediminis TaxID=1982043 RepID=UPI0011785EB6|nr:glycosyltransferase family 4 protein [Mangrovitalea sediminis]